MNKLTAAFLAIISYIVIALVFLVILVSIDVDASVGAIGTVVGPLIIVVPLFFSMTRNPLKMVSENNTQPYVAVNKVYKDTSSLELVDKMDGQEFEHFCADLLKRNGFFDVEITKGSGDQGIDIIAKKDDIRYGIQCKCYSSDLGNKPIQEAYTGKSYYRCQVAAVLTNRYFTRGAIEAANATGVILWDRDKLKYFIDNAK